MTGPSRVQEDLDSTERLRQRGEEAVQVTRVYLTALSLVRKILALPGLTAEQRIAEISLVFEALGRVQEDLDSTER